MAMDRETVLRDLRELGAVIEDLETELKPLRDKRNRRILKALELGVTEWAIVNSGSGITRGWIWRLKLKHGLADPKNKPRNYNATRVRREQEIEAEVERRLSGQTDAE